MMRDACDSGQHCSKATAELLGGAPPRCFTPRDATTLRLLSATVEEVLPISSCQELDINLSQQPLIVVVSVNA